jgi:AcrR family transcriptional regulator
MKPRKRTRNLAETRRAILAAAFEEIHAHGFHASSVDAILDKTGLTKGALFHQFASKLELGAAVVDEVLAPMTLARWVEPLAAFEDPLEGILHQMRANIGDAPQAMLNLGCPVNNLIQEMANSDRELQRRLRAVLEAWIEGIAAHVKRGQRSGHVRRSADARQVAEWIVTSHEGVFSVVKAMRDKRALASVLTSIQTVFAGLRPR